MWVLIIDSKYSQRKLFKRSVITLSLKVRYANSYKVLSKSPCEGLSCKDGDKEHLGGVI